jgi:hypothetical protein
MQILCDAFLVLRATVSMLFYALDPLVECDNEMTLLCAVFSMLCGAKGVRAVRVDVESHEVRVREKGEGSTHLCTVALLWRYSGVTVVSRQIHQNQKENMCKSKVEEVQIMLD